MKEDYDVYIKDEGDQFSTVCFVSNIAKVKIAESLPEIIEHGYRLDIDNIYLHKILTWAISHNFKIESEVSIMLPSKN